MPKPLSPWPLTARDQEIGAFTEAWSSPRLRTVMIFGPAGAGKTRLAEAFIDHAARAGYVPGRATATAVAQTIPLAAIAHLIPAGLDMADAVTAFAQVARVLAGRRDGRRRVLQIDDLHLLDTASAVLLRQLMDADVIRLIGTVRAGATMSDPVTALSSDDSTFRMDLALFDQTQVAEVLRAALGGPVAGRAVHLLSSRSGGNALYLRELVLGAIAAGSLSFDGEIWQLDESARRGTPQLAELIGERLSSAPPGGRAVLELLALCEPLPLADAEALADTRVLSELESAGLIAVSTLPRGTEVRLAHPLYGEALRANVPKSRRRDLLLAQIERTRATSDGHLDDARRIAAWQLTATGQADPDQLIQASRLARYADDPRQALILLEALPRQAHTAHTLLALAEVLLESGHPERAASVFAAAEAAVKTEEEALAVLQVRSYALYWFGGGPEQAEALIRAARPHVSSAEGTIRLRLNEGVLHVMTGDIVKGLALLEDLSQDGEKFPDRSAWFVAAMLKALALTLAGRSGEALALIGRLNPRELTRTGQGLPPVIQASAWFAMHIECVALCAHGRLIEARELNEECCREAAATDLPNQQADLMACYLGWIEWLRGRPAAARRRHAEAVALARAQNDTMTTQTSLCGLAADAALLGDLAAADRALAEVHDIAMPTLAVDFEAMGPAWLAVAKGDLAGARSVLTDAAARARSAGLRTAESHALVDVARLGGAADVAGRLAELAETCEGDLIPARARLAAALAADDPELLMACAEELHAMGADLMAAEAGSAAAAAWQHAGEPRKSAAATRLSDSCAELCDGVGTPLLSTRQTHVWLTNRQRDVAMMAAKGTSSRDIATALHLSVHTVNNHLHSVYTKLGVTTRHELAIALGDTRGHARSTAADERRDPGRR